MTPGWWRFDRFIFEEYKTVAPSLGIYRVMFAAYILVYLPRHLWVSNFPDSFFNPPIGLTVFFIGFPSAPFFIVVNFLAIVAAVCLLFGYMTRTASVSFALILLICNYWAYSFGKIDHDIPLIFIPLIMQGAGWGNGYSIDAKHRPANDKKEAENTAWPLALMALIVGIAMMNAALAKATSGWLDVHSHAVRAHLLYNVFVTGRSNWLAEHLLRIKSGAFWEFLDYGTVIIEASFLLTIGRRSAFRVVCALACFFHLGIALFMEIAFVANVLAYAVFVQWSTLESRLRWFLRPWNRILDKISGPMVLGLGSGVAFVYLHFGNPLQLPQEWDPIGVLLCSLAALVAGMFLIGLLRDWFRPPSQSVILFDGFCGLCNGWVDFILRNDRRMTYKFLTLQSPAGQEILNQFGLPSNFIASLVLVEDGRIYDRSSAVLRALRGLKFPYSAASAFIVIPRGLRDCLYKFLAAHRLNWFSKRDSCRVPSPEQADRFF